MRGAHERVVPVAHRGRTRVRLLAQDLDVELLRVPGRIDRAQRQALPLEDPALLDVDLRVPGHGVDGRHARVVVGAQVLDRGERLADADPLQVRDLQHLLAVHESRVDGAAHDGGREAAALLVEPVDDDQVVGGGQFSVAHLPLDLLGRVEGGDDAVGAVEAAALGLRVQVRAGHDDARLLAPLRRGQGHPGEQVPDPVHTGGPPPVVREPDEPVAGLPVLGGRRLPLDAARVRRADRRDLVECREERVLGCLCHDAAPCCAWWLRVRDGPASAGRRRMMLTQTRYWEVPRLRYCPSPLLPVYRSFSTMTRPRLSTVSTFPSISKPSHAL